MLCMFSEKYKYSYFIGHKIYITHSVKLIHMYAYTHTHTYIYIYIYILSHGNYFFGKIYHEETWKYANRSEWC